MFIHILSLVGLVSVLGAAYHATRFVQLYFLWPTKPLRAYQRQNKLAYALITGSSAGIGLGTAIALARAGFGVILLGHLPGELADAKELIACTVPGAVVEIIVLNAMLASPEEIEDAICKVKSLDGELSVLVNNVGGMPISKEPFRVFQSYCPGDISNVLSMNARFMSLLTSLVIPIFSKSLDEHHSSHSRCLILSLTSAGAIGLPYLTMYSATKAFNLALAAGLARELETHPDTAHIDSLAIMPGDVRSQGNSLAVSASAPGWMEYGAYIVRSVDRAVQQNRRIVVPYWLHALQIAAMEWLPESVLTAEVGKVAVAKRDAFNARWEREGY